jgi:hypothetical protein
MRVHSTARRGESKFLDDHVAGFIEDHVAGADEAGGVARSSRLRTATVTAKPVRNNFGEGGGGRRRGATARVINRSRAPLAPRADGVAN